MRRILLSLTLGLAILAGPGFSHAAVIISEFLAENDGGLVDQNGDTPDWIELFNNSLSTVSLHGWHLTDTPTNLTRWTFPATSISSGAFVIVFASGKDRATNGAELHTSFQLDNNGGYLALVQPDGVTIASAFHYPQQHRNVSFGSGLSNTSPATLLSNAAAALWFVPADGSLGPSWTAPGFDASTWSNATAPLRYDVSVGGTPGTPILGVDFNRRNVLDNSTNTAAGFQSFVISSNVNNAAIQTQATVRVLGGFMVTVSNSAPNGYDDRLRNTVYTNNGAFTENLIMRDFIFSRDASTLGGLDVSVAGLSPSMTYAVKLWSYDQQSGGTRVSDWFTNGALAYTNWTFDGRVYPTNDTQYAFGFSGTADPSGTLLISGRRKSTSVDTANAASFGVFLNALQIATINTLAVTNGNVAAMAGQNPSLFVRQFFNLADLASVNQLTLRVKYNDGFVAYLNGTEIARRNAPSSVDWNSSATATHSSAVSEDILMPGAAALLVAGANVLAVQGLNISEDDGNFYLEPQLLGTSNTVSNDRFFSPASPGSPNDYGFTDVVADTKFSVNRGFYDAPFSLSITCATPGAAIYFATNGNAPSPGNGYLFTSPISITGNSFIRAQAFLSGWVPSGVDTHSYIFLRDVLQQSNNLPGYPTIWQASYTADYAMDSNIVNHIVYGATLSNDLRSIPSLMIVSDQNGLWNQTTGIYPNPTSLGVAWERPASLELIRGDSHTEFATTAKIQIHGNASRDNTRTPKHSIGVSFNSDYGPTSLDYDWFGGGVKTHDGIVLRSCGFVDGWSGRYADNTIYTSSETGEQFRGLRYRPENTCYLRDVWIKDSFRDMGWISSRSAYVHLYLNGLYWGLYEPSEHVDASYFTRLLGGEEGAWDVVVGEDNNGPPIIVDGSGVDWTNVLNLVNAGITNEASYQAVAQLVDLDNLIDYMTIHIVGESEDWPRHNWYAYHRRATNGVPATKFAFTVWDQELTLDRLVRRNRIDVGNGADGAGEFYSPARLYARLRAWPEFRVRFGDRLHKHLFNGGALVPSNNVARLLVSASVISNAVVGESARWGDARKPPMPAGQIGTSNTFTRNEWWQPEIDKLATNFFQHLTADNVARFRAGSLYPSLGAPSFSQFGGSVPGGFTLTMTHTNASGTIYFTTDQSDPRVYGSGAVAPAAQSFATPLPINSPTVVRARVFDGVNWSALVEAVFYPPQDLSKLALTEIMYRPLAFAPYSSSALEFLELKNYGTNTLDLTGCGFTDGITFNFTNGTLLPPGQFFVIASSAAAFAARYPGVTINGLFGNQLANGGERLTLSQQAVGGPPYGPAIFSVNYGTTAPWPITPDGFGFSLVPKTQGLSQAPDDGTKWRASALSGGSPGADDPAPVIAPVVINEILTHTDFPAVDRIELFNPTGTNVDIGGWFLSDDAGVPKKFHIANGTSIAPGGFITFDESQFNATPGTNDSFSLSSGGEQVYLFSGDANTNLTGYSHGFNFGAAANGVSFGRYLTSVGEEHFPAQISQTFNAANSGPRVGPIVINEVHYHPVLPQDAFVELKNITVTNVPLFDPVNPQDTWKIEGLGFAFPTNVIVPPGGLVLVVVSNITGFIASHAVPTNVPVFTYQYLGEVQTDGERLSLTRPDAPDTNGTPYIIVDTVRYNDKAPWPAAADGSGPSLQRKYSNQYGDDPINWQAATTTPGRENADVDIDGDGVPDEWELAHGTNPSVPDANDDTDGDGFTNLQEYLAGTHPNDPQSRLHVERISETGGAVAFEFTAASNRTFTVLFKNSLADPAWSPLTNIASAPTLRTITISEPATNGTRFYRIAAP